MTSKLSVLGLWSWDNTLLDEMVLPDGVDPDLLRDNLLYSLADLEVLYPSAPFMKTMVGLWSRKELPTWERVYKASQEEYDPIENYNRIEEWTDKREQTARDTEVTDGESKDTGSTILNTFGNSTHSVAGYNNDASGSLTMVDQYKDADNNTQNTTQDTKREVDTTVSRNGSGTEDSTHKGRVHGNIGVTTSQQMLESELEIAPKLNIYNYIINSFKNRFCIMVY